MILYEDNDFLVTCSDTNFNKFIIFLNSAAGLDRVVLDGIQKAYDKAGTIPNGIYTPYNINEINFLCKNANWYQRKSIENCISVIKNKIAGHEENTVIYGSSMGGFGAIHFGAEFGITSIAFSPQATLEDEFDISPDWKNISEYSKSHFGFFNSNIINGKCNDSKIYMFYDGRHILDKKQALYIIKKCKRCISFNIPYAGHACTNVVNKYYKIKKIVMDILNGDFDPKKFRKEFYSLYNIYEYKRMNGLDYFYYLTNIIHDKKFYVTLGILNKNTYRDLCISLLHFVENNYLEFIDDIIICMCNKEKIIKNLICNIRSVKYMDIEIENESERIMICALFYYNRKKYTKALLLYNKLYNNEKTNIELCIMLAKTMHKIGLDDEAILLIRESIIINGRNDKLLSCISVILFEKKLYSESKKYLLALIKMRNNVNDYIYYARSLKEENRINDAINFLKNNITKFPENNPFMSHLGAYLIMDNQLYEGLLILNKVKETKNYPIWVDNWINKAQKLIIKNEHSLLAKLKEKNL